MIVAVIDTHALIWCITADQRLSQPARDTISQAVTSKQHIVLSTMSLIEIIYLIEKKRLPDDLLERLLIEMDTPGTIFTMIPIERPIIMTMKDIRRHEIPDMPDRVIAATACHLNVPLISRDRKIRCSFVSTIW